MGRTNLVWAYAVVPLAAATAAASLAVLDPFRVTVGLVRVLGLPTVAVGVSLVGWTVSTVRPEGETLSPVLESAQLLTSGPFARTRNPMYLGVLTTAAGTSVLGASPVAAGYTAVLWLVYHPLVVFIEEPSLREQFGTEYNQYCDTVPRWRPRLG